MKHLNFLWIIRTFFYTILIIKAINLYSQEKNIFTKVYEEAVNSVVYIETGSGRSGTGFLISSNGWIVTNKHVIQNIWGYIERKNNIEIYLRDGSMYHPTDIKTDNYCYDLDLAFLKINAYSLKPLPILDYEKALIQEEVLTIGHPGGIQWTSTKGVISNFFEGDNCNEFYMTDAAINPGNSGGPLLNRYGQVIGINTLKTDPNYMENTGFAISSRILAKKLRQFNINYTTSPLISSNEIEKSQEKWSKDYKVKVPEIQIDPEAIKDAEIKKEREKKEAEAAYYKYQREQYELEQKRLKANLPKRLFIILNGGSSYYFGSLSPDYKKRFNPTDDIYWVGISFGYRFDVTNPDELGNLLLIEGKVGRARKNIVTLSYSEQFERRVYPINEKNYLWEAGIGFNFSEIFKLSGGYGQQLYQLDTNKDIYQHLYHFYGTLGFNFNIWILNFDITSTFLYYDKFDRIACRLNLGMGFIINFFRN